MTPQDPLTPQAITRLLADSEPWLSCDDCFDQLDTAVEVVLEATQPLPVELRVHLSACTVCHEEAQSLATLVGSDRGIAAEEALHRLELAVAET